MGFMIRAVPIKKQPGREGALSFFWGNPSGFKADGQQARGRREWPEWRHRAAMNGGPGVRNPVDGIGRGSWPSENVSLRSMILRNHAAVQWEIGLRPAFRRQPEAGNLNACGVWADSMTAPANGFHYCSDGGTAEGSRGLNSHGRRCRRG